MFGQSLPQGCGCIGESPKSWEKHTSFAFWVLWVFCVFWVFWVFWVVGKSVISSSFIIMIRGKNTPEAEKRIKHGRKRGPGQTKSNILIAPKFRLLTHDSNFGFFSKKEPLIIEGQLILSQEHESSGRNKAKKNDTIQIILGKTPTTIKTRDCVMAID